MSTPKQGTPEWFRARRGRITGSRVAGILGISLWDTPESVMRSMVRAYHGAESEFVTNPAVEWGNANEAGARLDYELDTGNNVEPAFFDTFMDWLGASPDGYVGDDGLIEIKCPYGMRDNTGPDQFKSIDGQPHYYGQIQIQLHCTRRAWCDFYQWAPGAQKLERVYYDADWLADALPKLKEFHGKFIDEIHNSEHLEPPRKVVTDKKAISLVEEYQNLREERKAIDDRMKAIIDELSEEHGQSEIDGHKLTKVERQGRISYSKAIKDLLPDVNLEPYRGKPSGYWRLS